MENPQQKLGSFLSPWFKSIENPALAQQKTLKKLLEIYSKSEYGRQKKCETITTLAEYQHAFPIMTYGDFQPYFERLKQGDYHVLLPESPIAWAMTRGTTGKSKFIPVTQKDLDERAITSPRGLLTFVYKHNRFDILKGYCLNLNFPSILGSFKTDDSKEIPYGYSSGLYAKLNADRTKILLVPTQQEIDEIGGGLTTEQWHKRFNLAYEKGKDKNVAMMIGVTQIMLQFGKYLKKKLGKYPKQIWDIKLLGCTSVDGIQTKYRPSLRGLYGDVIINEIYGATEGIFAQQLDQKSYVVPNFDVHLFEVEVKGQIKLLHQMKRGEIGNLIVSTHLLPRYRIGDVVKSYDGNYYRCIGREATFSRWSYEIERIFGYA